MDMGFSSFDFNAIIIN